MTEKNPADAFYDSLPDKSTPSNEFVAVNPTIEVVDSSDETPVATLEVVSDIPPVEVSPEVKAPEASESSVEVNNEIADTPRAEKGWFGRSKDAIARGSENFLKKIAAGALESFDKNVTSRLAGGPARQIEKHNAAIAKNEKAILALNEMIANLPAGYSKEKGLNSLQKFEGRRDSSKSKLETATERFDKRNKWHEDILNTRNEFLQAVAGNYKTVEDAKMEQVLPLEKKLEVCNRLKSIMGERNKSRDEDNSTMITQMSEFKNKLKGAFTEEEIMKMPAIKEIQKNIEKNNDAKIDDLEKLKKYEDKIKSKYLVKKGRYDAVSKKRKDCEASISGKKEEEYEATADSISEIVPEISVSPAVETKLESNESEPKYSLKSQVELWNYHVGGATLDVKLDTTEIAAKAFKSEGEMLTRHEFVKIAEQILTSRGRPRYDFDVISEIIEKTV